MSLKRWVVMSFVPFVGAGRHWYVLDRTCGSSFFCEDEQRANQYCQRRNQGLRVDPPDAWDVESDPETWPSEVDEDRWTIAG